MSNNLEAGADLFWIIMQVCSSATHILSNAPELTASNAANVIL